MQAEHFRRIEALYRSALEQEPANRSAFLAASCQGDEELRRDVEALLDQSGSPLDRPALETVPGPVENTIRPGAQLGPYQIEGLLGAGGMGQVFRARDTRLLRTVAIKTLPRDMVADPDRKERLLREARAASALNHPNIVGIYDIGHAEASDYIVMEYIEGKTLDELIGSKGLPQSKVLRYAVQISDALAQAHGAGILHRDLKPGNIMVTEGGRVKILDFGLAKLFEPADSAADSETRTMGATTRNGALVGTAAYMSPEQAEGRKLDSRSDIFSFGCVLYEMVTGRRPFQADSTLALLSRIVNEDPQPPGRFAPVPGELEKLILRCLRKDPSRRYQTMADLKVALEDLQAETSPPPAQALTAPASAVALPSRPRSMRTVALWASAGAAAVALALIAIRPFRPAPETAALRTVKFTITPAQLSKGSNRDIDTAVFVSWDGRHIAYVESSGGQLWIRDLDQEQAHPVPGATGVYEAFWSPDNQYIGYATGRGCSYITDCDLVKIPVQGGTPVVITKVHGFRRAGWSSDGETIVYGDTTGLYTVPARGGPATRIVQNPPILDPAGTPHIEHPSFVDLPGGRRAVLFQAMIAPEARHGIYLQLIGEDRVRPITMTSSTNPYPAYSPTGHIIYTDGNFESAAIWALPFSLTTLQPTGKPFPIAQHGSSPRVSRTGTLVYSDVPSNHMQLVWCDRSGNPLSTIGEPMRQGQPALSPDGRRLVVQGNENELDLWMYDLDRGTKTRFTFDSAAHTLGAWTPSGDEVTYARFVNRTFDIFSKPSNGNGDARLLVSTPLDEQAPDWSPDRRFLIYTAGSREIKSQLLYRERRSDGSLGEPVIFLKTAFQERSPRFSPDGHFIAYVSDESGRNEVYVRDFPKAANQWLISSSGGTAPRWRRDGKEIFYLQQDKLMAVSVATHPAFSPGVPSLLFQKQYLPIGYDVSPDGKRFVTMERPSGEPPLAIHVVHNWFEEFRAGQGGQ